MKNLDNLAIKQTTDTDVGYVLPKILGQVIEAAARPHRIAKQLLRPNNQIFMKPGRSLDLRKRGTIVAADVAETATPADQDADYDTVIATPAKGGLVLKISQECIDDNEFDIIKDQMIEVGEAMAQWEDLKVWREIISGAAEQTYSGNGNGSDVKFTLGETNVTSIRSIKVDGVETIPTKIDMSAGKIQFTTAPGTGTANVVVKFWYYDTSTGMSSAGAVRSTAEINVADTGADFDLDDVREIRMTLENLNYTPDIMVVSPWVKSKLLDESAFIDASAYGAREPILNGEIGKIMGLKVISTTNLDKFGGSVLVIDSRHAGWYVNKRNMYIKKKELQENDAYAFYVYQRFAPKITNWGASVVCIEAGQYSATIS